MENNFFNQMKQTAVNDVAYNLSVTENGAYGFKTTGKALLDINFGVAGLRKASNQQVIDKFMDAYREDKVLALKWLFYARDVREGLGERRLFRLCFNEFIKSVELKDTSSELIELLQLVSEYGRFDDLYSLLELKDKVVESAVATVIDCQLKRDIDSMQNGKPVSLLAKWLKSEKASSPQSQKLAKWTMKAVRMKPSAYRKNLSALRKYIDVTEVKMTNNQWNEINYDKVPSRASMLYKEAFKRHDEERYTKFIDAVNKGEAKINAGTLYPHEIVNKYMSNGYWHSSVKDKIDESLEALWKNLPDLVKGNGTTLVVADGSGSMTCSVGNGQTTALNVANALAIYFAERASGPYKNKYITFSERPRFVDFTACSSLREKLIEALKHCECANTNIEAVFNLILDTAVKNNLTQDDIPANILIVSDMEFDSCSVTNSGWGERPDEALFQTIGKRFAEKGYELPRLVFWNVNSRTNTIPLNQNKLGVALVSGFSTNIVKMVMDNETDPFKCLLKVLNTERYEPIAKLVTEIIK